MRWRLNFLLFCFLGLQAALIFRIFDIQLGHVVDARGGGLEDSIRGTILFTDRDKTQIAVALNKYFNVVYSVPSKIQRSSKEDIASFSKALSPLLNRDESELSAQFSKKNDNYELLAEKISDDTVNRVSELKIPGIYTTKELLRFYPFGELGSHLIGFASPKEKGVTDGKYGVELQFQEKLRGAPNKEGNEIALTIDHVVERRAQELLRNLVQKYQAEGGTIIVQEATRGALVALVNEPSFDPNVYSQFSLGTFINPAVQSIYEPGSVFKAITMASGIESKKITPETAFIDTGSVTLNKKTIQNWDQKSNGKQTMTNVLELSINTGAVFAEQKIGHDLFYNFLVKFGFKDPTGIALPGEVRSNIGNLKNGKDIEFATASFGQGIAVTPIALTNAFAAIANGGKLMKPIISAEESPKVIRRVVSEDSAKTVTNMLISAVEKNKVATIQHYAVAGKTGTAYIPDFVKGGYTDKVIDSFIGFAPALSPSGPKYVVLIKLDKPLGSPVATITVAPAFRELMQFILNYYNIPPDKL